MKTPRFLTVLAVALTAIIPASGQTAAVQKTVSTNALTAGFVVPSSKNITFNAGATLSFTGQDVSGLNTLQVQSASTSGNPALIAYNNQGAEIALESFGSGVGGTLFGVNKAGAVALEATAGSVTSPTALIIGSSTGNVPIVFGANGSEVARFSSSGLTLTSALGAASGGTGQNTWALGDLVYGSGSNTTGRLFGNTTTTKKFLTQTGNGSVSAAPGWNTIVDADIPSTLTSKTLTGSAFNGTVGATTPSTGAFTTLSATAGDAVATFTASTNYRALILARSAGGGAVLQFKGTSIASDYNWFIGQRYNTANALEIMPSSALAGDTPGTAVAIFTSNGLAVTGTVSATGSNSAPGTSGSATDYALRLNPSAITNLTLDGGTDSSGSRAWLQVRDKTNYASNLTLALNPNGGGVTVGGGLAVTGTISATSFLKYPSLTVSGAGSASTAGAGAAFWCTDLTAITSGSTATGGGSLKHLVISDGTNWIVQ